MILPRRNNMQRSKIEAMSMEREIKIQAEKIRSQDPASKLYKHLDTSEIHEITTYQYTKQSLISHNTTGPN